MTPSMTLRRSAAYAVMCAALSLVVGACRPGARLPTQWAPAAVTMRPTATLPMTTRPDGVVDHAPAGAVASATSTVPGAASDGTGDLAQSMHADETCSAPAGCPTPASPTAPSQLAGGYPAPSGDRSATAPAVKEPTRTHAPTATGSPTPIPTRPVCSRPCPTPTETKPKEPTRLAEPTRESEPTHAAEPTQAVEPTQVVEPTHVPASPAPAQPQPTMPPGGGYPGPEPVVPTTAPPTAVPPTPVPQPTTVPPGNGYPGPGGGGGYPAP